MGLAVPAGDVTTNDALRWHDITADVVRATIWTLGLNLAALALVEHIYTAVRLARIRAQKIINRAEYEKDQRASARLFQQAFELLVVEPEPVDQPDDRVKPADALAATKTVPISLTTPDTTRFLGADNRYRLDAIIGAGGMGVIHEGFDTVLQRRVALKQLFGHTVNQPEHALRFKQEATALAALSHQHIVAIYDMLEEAGNFWIVMELLKGGSLGIKLRNEEELSIDYSVDVICKIADGLDYAHRKGIVHRDIKPMNVLLTESGVPKLADFGNARLPAPSYSTQSGVTLGSPYYISPERAAGRPDDHRGDIYSLGVTLYHMITGQVPFTGDLQSILAQHISMPPIPPSVINTQVPRRLCDVILLMMRKRPEERFRTAKLAMIALRNSIDMAKPGA